MKLLLLILLTLLSCQKSRDDLPPKHKEKFTKQMKEAGFSPVKISAHLNIADFHYSLMKKQKDLPTKKSLTKSEVADYINLSSCLLSFSKSKDDLIIAIKGMTLVMSLDFETKLDVAIIDVNYEAEQLIKSDKVKPSKESCN